MRVSNHIFLFIFIIEYIKTIYELYVESATDLSQSSQAGSITLAAEELHLTQPAVSIQLKNFQTQFDITISTPFLDAAYLLQAHRWSILAAIYSSHIYQRSFV